ncbi:Ig-like domain-containing protein [Leyella stercorea]|uniref:Ig-like domain-containing protein n=1 Tax=Leyella stercorea TaxID=363265 RepID=UPI001F197461|nr:Ig-like domain-containing protein [Leyella stercorea]MCF2615491.1 Ig-like domain-containing protein [Leyella stercorea]
MIKHLRFFMLNLLVLVSAAVMAQTTIDFTKLTWSSPFVQSPYTFSAEKNSGSTAPTQNGTTKDIRLYAKNSLTVSTSSEKMCTIVFHISKKGLDQWAEFTPNNGSVTVSKTDKTVTWENKEGATSVTFTVGDKCKYGTAATTKAGQFCFDSVDITTLGGSSATSTSLTFGADVDGKTFVVRQGDSFADKTATVTPADAKGSISYASDNEEAISVDATTGAVSFLAFGKATITATFTPEEGYLGSSASYTIAYRQAADPTKVIFDANEGAFDCFGNENKYKEGEFDFVDLNGDSYTFTVHNAMLNNYGSLQLKKNSTSDATQQGYAISPAFGKFPNGYRVTVKYKDQNAPELECTNHAEDVAVFYDANGTMYMDVPFADGMFKLSGASQVAYVQSIELTPLAKKEPQPVTMTFPQDVYTCYTNEAPLFDGFTPTIKNAAGEVLKLPVTYTSSNTDFCMVTSSGTVQLLQNPGEVTITAKFAGNDDYLPAEASYLIRVIEKEKAEAGIAFEETMQLVDLAKKTITAEELGFKNPNNLAVTYSSNKTDVAEVDAEGNVTLKKAGRVNIDVTFAGNDEYKAATASCTLIVNDYRNTPELAFDQEEYTANMREGNTFSGATLYNKSEVAPLTYTSSNEEVAEVAANGVVILRSTGETTITVWFAGDNDFKATSASYKLTVIDEVVNGIQNITIDNMPEDAKVYNLNGQRMNAKALKSGVYVVNGKKVVLK